MRRFLTLVLAAFVFLMASSIGAAYTRPLLVGRNGIVLAGHPVAAQAGMRILQQGGNAFDAVIAAASVQAVMEPHATGMGGQGPIAIYDAKTKQVRMLHGYGEAPMAATVDLYPDSATQLSGPLSVAVPANVAVWCELNKTYGSMPLSQVLEQAIDYAENGFPVGEFLAERLQGTSTWMKLYPSTAKVFMPGGKVLGVGDLLVQRDLANSLREVALGGHDAFYKGSIARKIDAFMKEEGGILTYEDMAKHQAKWVEPIRTNYRGYDVFAFPLPSSAATTLMILNILENFDLKALGQNSPDYWHLIAEACKLAWADRCAYMADPNFVKVPMAGLLSKAYAKERAKLISLDTSLNPAPAGKPAPYDPEYPGNTTQTTVIDKWGNIAVYTSTVYNFWGSRMVAEGTGIVLNDAMGWLDRDPESVNRIEGGKIPLCNMDPIIILKDGKPFFATGSPGGPPILYTTAQMVINAIDFQMNPQAAVEVPRIVYYPDSDPAKSRLNIEPLVPQTVIDGMKAKGQNISAFNVKDYTMSCGGHLAVKIDPTNGALLGGADPRREGYGVAW
ncbi:MAG: gamma-glutamyltransferase [Firmicutes bacterium]|jgi:gamma-glutamyltranspeptidase/glutathione hydrolase|nr:gamma-glutamyltransferase [Bacillota bacterium]